MINLTNDPESLAGQPEEKSEVNQVSDLKIQQALENLERKLFSLNYDGYFTKNFFMETKEALGLSAAFRVFFRNTKPHYVHSYYRTPAEIGTYEQHIKYFASELDANKCKSSFDELVSQNVWSSKDWPLQVRKTIFEHQNHNDCSYIIPVWKCSTGCCLFSCQNNVCKSVSSPCGFELQGLIVLCGEKGNSEPLLGLDENGYSKYWKTIARLFKHFEEPVCFGNYDEQCKPKECGWENNCKRGTIFPSPPQNNDKKNRLDLDEILYEWKEKFRKHLIQDSSVFILKYDANKRHLSYRSVEHMVYPQLTEDNWTKFQEKLLGVKDKDLPITENQKNELVQELKNDLIDDAKGFVAKFHSTDEEKKFETLKASIGKILEAIKCGTFADFSEHSLEPAKELLKLVKQRTNTGLTRFIWQTFESMNDTSAKMEGFAKTANKIQSDDSGAPQYGELLREFCEKLFLISLNQDRGFILSPLGYIGQKLGLIIASVDNKIRTNLANNFNHLASEFSPLLYHSLQDQLHQNAILSLKSRNPNEIIQILCEELPTCFNVTAIIFYPEGNGKQLIYGFDSVEDGNRFTLLDNDSDNNKVGEKYLKEHELYRVLPFNEYSILNDLKCYSCTSEKDDEVIKTKSRLFFQLQHNLETQDQDRESLNASGAIELYFDISEYSLKRFAPDIVRELEYISELLIESAAQKTSILRHAVKAATNAIISRNHSHHIGSHVTPRTSVNVVSEKLASICDIEEHKWKSTHALHHLKLRMESYVQQKADFIAEIATTPLYTTCSKWLFKDVLCNFIQNTLFMDNIGANEGVNYQQTNGEGPYRNRLIIHFDGEGKANGENKIIFKGKEQDFSNLDIPYFFKYEGIEDPSFDYLIAWPGPLGEYALYCFLENLIRNSIKHNRYRLSGCNDVNIHMQVLKCNFPYMDDYYSFEIWDNITDPKQLLRKQHLCDSLQDTIDKPIIENDGSLIDKAWGIAEMKIMTTLLGGSNDFLDMDNLKVKTSVKDAHKRLVYKFNCLKAKEILVISKSYPKDDAEREILKKAGIYSYRSLKEFNDTRKKELVAAVFDIAILDSSSSEFYSEYCCHLPFRIISETDLGIGRVHGKGFIESFYKQSNHENMVNYAWLTWSSKFRTPHKKLWPIVVLNFDQDKDFSPTSDWHSLKEKMGSNWPKIAVADKSSSLDLTQDDIDNSIFFDRHLNISKKNRGDFTIRENSFVEEIGGKSLDFLPLFTKNPSKKLVCQLLESASLNILIIDERIAEASKQAYQTAPGDLKKVFKSGYLRHVAERAKILIATHLIINNDTIPVHTSLRKEENEDRIAVTIDTEIFKNSDNKLESIDLTMNFGKYKTPDCLILHQGIFHDLILGKIDSERVFDSKEVFIKILTEISNYVPYIIIVSGRGISSSKLPDNVKFIPFSLLEKHIMQGLISKLSLTKIIMSIVRDSQ